jgi:hypothetical protein
MTQDKKFQAEVIFLNPYDARRAITELNNAGFDVEVMDWVYPIDDTYDTVWVIASCAPGRNDDELESEVSAAVEPFDGNVYEARTSDISIKDEVEEHDDEPVRAELKHQAEFKRRLAGITQRKYRNARTITLELSLAAMPKFILEVKNGIILLHNVHVPHPDGWYWRGDTGPLIGPFESIEDARKAAAIASDPEVEINIINTEGRIAKASYDPPEGRVPKLANDPMHEVEIKLAFDELERRGLIRKTGDFREGLPTYVAVDRELKELPEGLTFLQQNLFRYLQSRLQGTR